MQLRNALTSLAQKPLAVFIHSNFTTALHYNTITLSQSYSNRTVRLHAIQITGCKQLKLSKKSVKASNHIEERLTDASTVQLNT